MKLIDALNNVKRPPAQSLFDFEPPMDVLTDALSMPDLWDYPDDITNRLQCYPIYEWLCTDEHVGLSAVYFDDEPVAAIYRECRKCPYHVKWVSDEKAKVVRDFLMTFIEPEDSTSVINGDEEIDLNRLAYLSGRAVELEVGD